MNDDISDKVKALLEDPDMVAKIAAIASSLGGSNSSPAAFAESETKPAESEIKPAAVQTNSVNSIESTISKLPDVLKTAPKNDPRVELLKSLKPFLRSDRQSKVDNLTRALSVANLFGTINKDKNKK